VSIGSGLYKVACPCCCNAGTARMEKARLRGAGEAKSGYEESSVDGLPEVFETMDEDFLEAEAGDESVVIARFDRNFF